MINVSCSVIYESCVLPELLGTLLCNCVRLNQQGCHFPTSFWARSSQAGSISAGLLKKSWRGCSPLRHSRISVWILSISDHDSTGLFCHVLLPSQCSDMTATTILLHLGHSKPHRHPSCDTWGFPQKYNLPVVKTRARRGLSCQQLPAISRSTS